MCYFLLKPSQLHQKAISSVTSRDPQATHVCAAELLLPTSGRRRAGTGPHTPQHHRAVGLKGPLGTIQSNLCQSGKHRAVLERCTLHWGYVCPQRSGRLREAPAPSLHSGHGLWPSRRDGDCGLRASHARLEKPRHRPTPNDHRKSHRSDRKSVV